MIKHLLTYALLFISLTSLADFTQGNALYEEGNYEAAIEQYSLEVADGVLSSELFYNLGNAHYRNGDLGKAIWAYESALKIDPGHDDALFNLEFANAQTIDKIDTSRHGFGHWLQATLLSFCINIWTYISLGCSLLFAAMVILFLRSKEKRNKNLSLLGATILGFLLTVATLLAYLHQNMIQDQTEAVVITDTQDIKVSPTKDAKTTFILSEGAKVRVIGKKEEWIQIDLNGNQGWLPHDAIWKI